MQADTCRRASLPKKRRSLPLLEKYCAQAARDLKSWPLIMLLFLLVPLAVLGVLSTALVVFLLGVPLVTLPHGKSGQPRKLMAGRYTAPPPPTVS